MGGQERGGAAVGQPSQAHQSLAARHINIESAAALCCCCCRHCSQLTLPRVLLSQPPMLLLLLPAAAAGDAFGAMPPCRPLVPPRACCSCTLASLPWFTGEGVRVGGMCLWVQRGRGDALACRVR